MSGSELRLVVSVQARGCPEKPRDGHLATGGGDLWSAPESIGAVTPGVREAVTPDLPHRAAEIGDARRAPGFDHQTPRPGPAPMRPVIPACATGR